eukprot:symbB.v1.2.020906.t2/scaffold1784.1/size101483/2
MDEERNDKIFDYSDFEQLHRPYSDWGDQEFNREADDYEDEDDDLDEELDRIVAEMEGIVCPERYMCGPYPGNTEPVACPAGSFNPWQGQWNCTVCLEGGVCPHSRMRLPLPCPCGYECRDRGTTRAQNLCPAGLMCDEGVATNIEPQLCEPKTFDIRVDTSLSREREKICVYGIGQQYVDYQRLATGTENRFCGWKTNAGPFGGRF